MVRTLDIMPTALDLLAIKATDSVDRQMRGVSLLPLMNGEHLKLDAIAETDYLNRVFKRSIRTSDGWKLIVSLDNEKRELYNLDSDSEEMADLAGEEPRMVYELEQRLFSLKKAIKPY